MSQAIPAPCLCLVTDRRNSAGRALEDVVAEAVAGGANMVQLREKDLSSSRLLHLANSLREITAGRALLFVNDRVDVALACGADGVQLGEEGLPVTAARGLAGERLLLGRSVHSTQGAITAERDGADLLLVGAIFPSKSHTGGPTGGLGLLRQVRDAVTIPFLAIGGLNPTNTASAIENGATGAALITAISLSADPRESARELMETMKGAQAAIPGERATRTV